MRNIRLFALIIRRSGLGKTLIGFLLLLTVCAFIVQVAEPGITNFRDALWFLWAVSTTVGLGDFTAVTTVGRITTVLCSLYAIITVAVITGVFVDYFNERRQVQLNNSLTAFLDKLENLPDLSKEELAELSEGVKRFRK